MRIKPRFGISVYLDNRLLFKLTDRKKTMLTYKILFLVFGKIRVSQLSSAYPRSLAIIMIYLITINGNSQDSPMVSGDYTNSPLREVVVELEQKSGYSFFFLEDMVVKDSITATFDNKPISLVLDQVLEGTSLNHYILKAEKR